MSAELKRRCPQCGRELDLHEMCVARNRCYGCCAAGEALHRYWRRLGLHVIHQRWLPWVTADD